MAVAPVAARIEVMKACGIAEFSRASPNQRSVRPGGGQAMKELSTKAEITTRTSGRYRKTGIPRWRGGAGRGCLVAQSSARLTTTRRRPGAGQGTGRRRRSRSGSASRRPRREIAQGRVVVDHVPDEFRVAHQVGHDVVAQGQRERENRAGHGDGKTSGSTTRRNVVPARAKVPDASRAWAAQAA